MASKGSAILANDVDIVQQLSLYCLKDQDVRVFNLVELVYVLVNAIIQDVEALGFASALELGLHSRPLRGSFCSRLRRVKLGQRILVRETLPVLGGWLRLVEVLPSILALRTC